jgi:hypothetical protein
MARLFEFSSVWRHMSMAETIEDLTDEMAGHLIEAVFSHSLFTGSRDT